MTEAIYLAETETRSFEATVERVADDRVVLDRTAFYPTGGGQPHDTGTLEADGGTWDVVGVEKKDTIYHRLDGGDPPSAGTTVTGTIDWERRYGHMRHHTAQHLVSAVLLEEFDAETTGNQVYAERARIDCAYPKFDDGDLDHLEARVNDYVERAIPVEWYTLEREEAEERLDPERTRIELLPDSIREIRIVEIAGVDRTACAGTHVSNTADVGMFEVTGRETKGSDEERVNFRLR
ncbi:alanyl-tRNA editing protein [Halocalculus aciditolerans]|uniref:Alanyl-tRNA editing protein n=1 Tax=Halocalculus aciditolerans TaxID=1383812 RepID=A0A830FCP6_9EURY|nr:alanyl-tRNA editing protein [Halocalculus aciditolerans]GGL61646.1 alanyl-tRNA editing protein [Halocalculus aciditolerans]